MNHQEKVASLVTFLKNRVGTDPLSIKKKAVSHQVPKVHDKRYTDEKIDLSEMNEIICIDKEKCLCIAEPGVTFVDLVKETLKYNLVPYVVPELKTITLGGAVAGASLESMSFQYGGFHDSCREYEVVTAQGDVLLCRPDNEHQLIFQMMHGTFGTCGILTQITFQLLPAKQFVHVQYEKYATFEEYVLATYTHYNNKDSDFMDGIIHSPGEYVLSVGNFVDTAPYTHHYDRIGIYHHSTRSRKEDYLKTQDYFFRYEKGVTNVFPTSFIGRVLFGRFFSTTRVLSIFETFRKYVPAKRIPITIDLFIPFNKLGDFFDRYKKEVGHFPLRWVPYKKVRNYERIDDTFAEQLHDELLVDIAIYGMKSDTGKNYYRLFEEELLKLHGIKTLISHNYYTEEEFWSIWNKKNYDTVKRITDPKNIFRNLYTKMCRASRGLE